MFVPSFYGPNKEALPSGAHDKAGKEMPDKARPFLLGLLALGYFYDSRKT